MERERERERGGGIISNGKVRRSSFIRNIDNLGKPTMKSKKEKSSYIKCVKNTALPTSVEIT